MDYLKETFQISLGRACDVMDLSRSVYHYQSKGRPHMKRKSKRRLPARILQPLEVVGRINVSWSMDFMSDSLLSGRKFRVLNLLDDFNREALTIEVDTSLRAERVIRSLEQIIQWRGTPQRIRVDNGPEFISSKLGLWCEERNIRLQFIRPGKPSRNAYIERFNWSFRRDILDAYLFESLNQVRILAEEWMQAQDKRVSAFFESNEIK